jgi:hypothetical protein
MLTVEIIVAAIIFNFRHNFSFDFRECAVNSRIQIIVHVENYKLTQYVNECIGQIT